MFFPSILWNWGHACKPLNLFLSFCHIRFIPQKFLSTFTSSFWTQKKCNSSFTRPTLWHIFLPLLSTFLQDFSVYPFFSFPFSWLLSPSLQTCWGQPYLKICSFLDIAILSFPVWSPNISSTQVHLSLCLVPGPQKCPTNIHCIIEWIIQLIMFSQRAPSPLLLWHCFIPVLLLSLWSFPLSPFSLIL